MTMYRPVRLNYRIAMVALAAALTACETPEKDHREHRVVMEHALHDGMKTMASHLLSLTSLSMDQDMNEEDKTGAVLRELEGIKSTALSIGGPEVITNYSVVNRYMGAFLYDVEVAKQFSNRSPPNHIPAYRLVKSCMSCHDSL